MKNRMMAPVSTIEAILECSGATYPLHILQRRYKLLTKAEKSRIDQMVMEMSMRIDQIISDRAEKANDPWK